MYKVKHIYTGRWLVDRSIYPTQMQYDTDSKVADVFSIEQLSQVKTYDIFDETQWEWILVEETEE